MTAIRRALLWALSGSAIGATLWAVIGGSAWLAQNPAPTLAENIRAWPYTVLGSGYWALYIGAVAAPCYTIVFVLWQVVVRRRPDFDVPPWNRALAALALATPPIVRLTVGFAWSDNFGFNWREAAWVFPVASASCWGAVYLPRRLFASLRRPLGASAG